MPEISDYKKRREDLKQMMGKGTIAILPACPIKIRNRDAEYDYRPDSDFYYLSGFSEPEAVLVLVPGREHGEYILFCRERDPKTTIWTGEVAGQEGAVTQFEADDSFPIDDLDDILPGLLEGIERVYYTMGTYPDFDKQLIGWVNGLKTQARSGVHTPGEFISLDHFLHELRLFKSLKEQKLMRQAAKISSKAHKQAMKLCQPGFYEYQLEAELIHQFMKHGARHSAYTSIVGGGANAVILHYVNNDAELKDNDLVLIDAGAEYGYYAADITRTFPVNGVFTTDQRAIYQIVLDAQNAAIEQVQVGKHWNDPHVAAVEVITRGLLTLGILSGELTELIKEQAYKLYYMHRTGHWLGMDVHDVGDYKVENQWRLLEKGMVLTVEPGIYIAANSDCDERWWNIGIRIEDDVLVTKNGPDVLSKDAPKDPDAIESLMAAG
ncbi:Xaa-Pro aminopeptidase [hydrothermal vent metagenome]|uniref:Xaa-Pro aminopeptidase n=1 Tax=hydrothermal vent metagenome TaxID=652676 RepID=A0A3B1AEC5_9ZZZZ